MVRRDCQCQNKKLRQAARWILGERPDLEALRADLAAYGLALVVDDLPEQHLDIWPENWPAVQLFDAMQTQWRHAPLGGLTGLDYGVLQPVADMLGFNAGYFPGLFYDTRIMEHEALAKLTK